MELSQRTVLLVRRSLLCSFRVVDLCFSKGQSHLRSPITRTGAQFSTFCTVFNQNKKIFHFRDAPWFSYWIFEAHRPNGEARVRSAVIVGIILGQVLLVGLTSCSAGSASPYRVCDWIGPGGRAVYRCTVVYPTASQNAPPRAKTCAWIGPGGRASYVCR